jgi:hypothetical protein
VLKPIEPLDLLIGRLKPIGLHDGAVTDESECLLAVVALEWKHLVSQVVKVVFPPIELVLGHQSGPLDHKARREEGGGGSFRIKFDAGENGDILGVRAVVVAGNNF